MEYKKRIIILGTGGSSLDIFDIINDINFTKSYLYDFVGFLDDDKSKWGKEIFGYKILGNLEMSSFFPNCFFVNGIGNSSNFWKKENIISRTKIPLERFETIIHPTASISKTATIGKGSVIFQNVTININVKIGNHVIILPNTIISHDCIIDDYTCISSGVCVSGNVHIGKSSYLGANSSIIENITIGDYSLIGMGSVILNSISENSVFVGNPAKFLRHTKN